MVLYFMGGNMCDKVGFREKYFVLGYFSVSSEAQLLKKLTRVQYLLPFNTCTIILIMLCLPLRAVLKHAEEVTTDHITMPCSYHL